MNVPSDMSYYLGPGDEIPDGVLVNLSPDDSLIAACVAEDPVMAAAAQASPVGAV